MADEAFEIDVPGSGVVSALRTTPDVRRSNVLFVYAPGAGSNLNDPFGAYCARVLASEGIESWRFQFPYMQAKRPAPDRPPVLEATWRAVVQHASETSSRVLIGGRSMGGRIASMVVAHGTTVAGLALFAYPLHPPGHPEKARDEHLPAIEVPTLFCCGNRDTFGTPDELSAAAALVKRSTVHFLEGADHGFAVLKASGRSRDDVYAEACGALLEFVLSL